MILLDTSVLVYAVGVDHPLRGPARGLITAIGADRIAATTTVEVVQEFTHVRARRRDRDDAAALSERYASLLSPLVAVDADDLALGLRLFRDHAALGSFDAVLAAVARRREHLTALVSADRAFAGVDGVNWIDLAASDLEARLGLA